MADLALTRRWLVSLRARWLAPAAILDLTEEKHIEIRPIRHVQTWREVSWLQERHMTRATSSRSAGATASCDAKCGLTRGAGCYVTTSPISIARSIRAITAGSLVTTTRTDSTIGITSEM